MSEFEGQNKNRPEHVNNKTKAKAGGGTATHDVARLAVGLLLHGEEGLAAQLGAAGHADEAVDVEDLVHSRAAGALAHHVLPTAGAATCRQGGGTQRREERNSRETKLNQQSDAASNRQPTASWTQPGEKTRALPRQWCQGTLSVQRRPDAFCFLVWVVVAKGLLVLHSDKLMRKNSNTSREKFTEF